MTTQGPNSSRPQAPADWSGAPQPTETGVPSPAPATSSVVQHQHFADPLTASRQGAQPASPYLVNHPSPEVQQALGALPPSFGEAAPGDPAAGVEPPPPEPQAPRAGSSLIGTSEDMLKAIRDKNQKKLKSAAPRSVASQELNRPASQGFFPPLDPGSPSGYVGGFNAADRVGGMADRLVDKAKHPGLHQFASMGLNTLFAPTIMASRRPMSYISNPASPFGQRLATNYQALSALQGNSNNPLLAIASRALGSWLGGDSPHTQIATEELRKITE